MAKESKTCEHCSRTFTPCPFNKHSQVYCTHPDCRLERARARKREWYKENYRKNAEFQEAERQRCQKGLRQRRQKAREKPPPPPTSALESVSIHLLIAGLLAQSLDTVDRHDVLYLAREYESRGQGLTTGTAVAAPNAVLPPERTVPRHPLSLKSGVPRHSPGAAPP